MNKRHIKGLNPHDRKKNDPEYQKKQKSQKQIVVVTK